MGRVAGARFAILSRNGFRVEELKWAGFWLGAIPVPINVHLASPEIAHILEDSACAHVFAESMFAPMFEHPALATRRSSMTNIGDAAGLNAEYYEAMLAAANPASSPDEADPDADALLIYTG
ncbi:MAG: acyl--CoA ligase [Ideonella sp.]|nr:acyl--CoA ligase [Betaproteobacteria bacterium]MBK6864824.1 acyl--CoA ligase [Ideonella sp.]